MKKFWSKSCTLALAFIMLCSAFAGVPLQMVTATDGTGTTEDLLVVDENLTLTPGNGGDADIIRQDGQPYGLQYIDFGLDAQATMNDTTSEFIVEAKNSAAWDHRLLTESGFSTPQDGKVTAEMKFKVRMDNYTGVTIPNTSLIFLTNGISVQQSAGKDFLSAENDDVSHTVTYTIDPEAKTIVGVMDGQQIASQSYDLDLSAPLQNLGIYLEATEAGIEQKDPMTQSVFWTIESFKVTKTDAGSIVVPTPTPTPTPTATPETVTETIVNIDDNIALSGNNISQDGATVQLNDWNNVFSDKSNEEGSAFSAVQTLSSAWQSRMYFTAPTISSDKETVIETRFKVEAAGDANGKSLPQAKITFYANGGVYDNNTALTYSPAGEEEVWHTYRVTLSPDGRTAVANLDNVNVTTVTYNEGNPFSNLGFGWQACNADSDFGAEGVNGAQQTLDVPIKWTFDYFKVTQQSGGTVTPTPDPGTGEEVITDLINVDNNMVLEDSWMFYEGDRLGNTIQFTSLQSKQLNEDGSEFIMSQTQSAKWQGRLLYYNYCGGNAQPGSLALGTDKVVAETKFKVKAASYTPSETVQIPHVGMMFTWNHPSGAIVLEPTSDLPLSAETEDTWHVSRAVIDPQVGTVTLELDGEVVRTANIPAGTESMQNIWFTPVAQTDSAASGQSDGTALNNTVTWNFDYFKLYTVGDAPAPTPTPTPVPETGDMLLIDEEIEYNSDSKVLSQGESQITIPDSSALLSSIEPTEDQSAVVIEQAKTSVWNNRLNITSPANFSMDKITVLEAKFRVKTKDSIYTSAPKLGFMLNSPLTQYILETSMEAVQLSELTEGVDQTIQFIINPRAKTITAMINGDSAGQASFKADAPTDVFSNISMYLAAYSDDKSDGKALTSPIEWTFDYFKTYQEDFPKETGDLLVIDKNMRLEGGVNLKEGNYHIFDNYYAEEEQEPGEPNTDPAKKFVLLNADEEEIGAEGPGEYYMMQQSHVSKYQHAMGITSPAEILMDNEINFEIKFKLRAADYSQNTYAKFMLVWRPAGPGTQAYFYEMNTNIPLTAESADVLQTVVFTVDPEAETITAKLNGNEVGSYPFTTNDADKPNFDVDTMQAVYIYPVAQLSGGTGEDSTDLGNTLTWIYDSFRIYKPDGEEVEPTPPPVYDPLAEAVSSGAFSSDRYEAGTGKDDTKQLFSKTISLGDEPAMINKIELDHDSSQIMSYSFEYSPDGLTYHPLTVAYPGEVDTYSGQQTFRFAPVPARFVRYNATLLEKKDTQARVNDVTISYVDTTELNLSALPGSVNPVLTDEVVLKAVATDSAQDTYAMPNEGVVWSIDDGAPDGVTLDGTSLRFAKTTAAGQVTVTATDASSDTVVSTKTIQIVPQVAARNFALYADEAGTTPITSLQAGSTVYARAEVLAAETLAQKGIQLTLGAYRNETSEASGEELIAVATPVIQDAPTDDYAPVTVSLTLPDDFKDGDYIRAFIWEKDSVQPLADSISYGLAGGQSVADVFLKKSGTFTATAAGATTWETADDYVATVENGVITANHEGNTVITAKNGEQVIATIPVRVKAGMYVFLSLGQSNMSGTNNPDLEGVEVPISDNVMLLNGENKFEPAQHPYRRYSGVNYIGGNAGDDDKVTEEGFRIMGWADAQEETGTNQGINMTYSFSEDLAAARPDIQIGLVQNSSSGSSVLTYEIDAVERGAENANGFVSNVARMTAALEGTDAEWKGILYHQGESDSQVSVYPTHLRNMIYDLKSALGEMEVPFIMGGLSEKNRAVYVTANARNRQEMLRIPFSTFVSSTDPEMLDTRADNEIYGSGVYLEDYTHISAKGQIEFGHRYYAAFTELINKIKR